MSDQPAEPRPEAQPLCDRCGLRPAVQRVRHIEGDRGWEARRFCEVCLAEGESQGDIVAVRGPLDDFLSQYLDEERTDAAAGVEVPIHQPIHHVDITRSFSDATRQLLWHAAEHAIRAGSREVDTDHLLHASLDEPVGRRVLERIGGDPEQLRRQLEPTELSEGADAPPPRLSPDTKRVLIAAFEESLLADSSYIGPEHVLIALAIDRDSAAGLLLRDVGSSQDAMRQLLAREKPDVAASVELAPSPTPTLDAYSTDLTRAAREGRLDPVVGRTDEIDQTIEILSRRLKNNPVLVGDPGVGKTAVVEAMAQRIVNRDIPLHLAGRRVVTLDLAQMVAGTRFRGEFEERLTSVVEEITGARDGLLLFIDELHNVVGAGSGEGAMDAADILKAPLGRGELQIIGATTVDEYRRHIEHDPALERRFQPILVPEPPVVETIQILAGLRDRYEVFHRVRITDAALRAAAELSARYVRDRSLPDKAVDLIDQASARVRLRRSPNDVLELEGTLDGLQRERDQSVAIDDRERASELDERIDDVRRRLSERRVSRHRAPSVTEHDVAEIVARSTGIPVARISQSETERLLRLEEQLGRDVIGQEQAVRAVSEAIRRNRTGLGDPDRPVGSFLFLGPTGVGKTQLAKVLTTTLFGDDEVITRLDMSEFQERNSVARLVGAPPGYVGYEEAGQFTEQLRRRPYSVVLLDEIEKAHPDVFNLLLQVLDDGRLSDAHGRTIDARNCVIIMTSNLGVEQITRGAPPGFGRMGGRRSFDEMERTILDTLRREFRPEFLNRIDDIVVFRPLTTEHLEAITGCCCGICTDDSRAVRSTWRSPMRRSPRSPGSASTRSTGHVPSAGRSTGRWPTTSPDASSGGTSAEEPP